MFPPSYPCLLSYDQHVHLLVEVDDLALSRIIQNLSICYTCLVTGRYSRTCHHYQGRYNSVLTDGDSDLLELVRYVHLKPVSAV